MKLLKPLATTFLTLFFLAWLLPTVSYQDWASLLIMAVVLTLLTKLIRPVLNLLFLPINLVTIGLFSIVINVFLLWLATYLVPTFQIADTTLMGIELGSFWTLVVISFLLGFIQTVVRFFIE